MGYKKLSLYEGESGLQLDRIKLAMVEEHERTGKVNLRKHVNSMPGAAEELASFALWLEMPASIGEQYAEDPDLNTSVLLKSLDRAIRSQRFASRYNTHTNWTHPSVLLLSSERDPLEVIVRRARDLVINATDSGWMGPPYDPIQLAEMLGVQVRPNHNVKDARVLPLAGNDRFVIEYNPNRPPARIRYSLAHEIIHTFFPDCGDYIRNRAARAEMQSDEWQLEMLCNIGAAELLMPIGSMPHLDEAELTIDRVLEYRSRFQVSTEAVLIRVARIASQPCAAFCSTRIEEGENAGRYRLDYAITSASWNGPQLRSALIPTGTRLAQSVSTGFTDKFAECWIKDLGEFYIECVAIPPYPGAAFPRVAGLIFPKEMIAAEQPITFLKGDATEPRGPGHKIIAHIVNDGAPRWGGGFAYAVRKKWPDVQADFIDWVAADRKRLVLGATHEIALNETCSIFHMVAQKGYGPADFPRLRYSALQNCLIALGNTALVRGASVHMPRIGTGQAGGNWSLVEELILSTVCSLGVSVTVYDLPNQRPAEKPQTSLEL